MDQRRLAEWKNKFQQGKQVEVTLEVKDPEQAANLVDLFLDPARSLLGCKVKRLQVKDVLTRPSISEAVPHGIKK